MKIVEQLLGVTKAKTSRKLRPLEKIWVRNISKERRSQADLYNLEELQLGDREFHLRCLHAGY